MELTGKADIHIHTTHSDGTASVPEVLAHVAASDLRVIAITDHDSIAGALEARRLARDFGVAVVAGEEVNTRDGHLLALYIESYLPPGRPAAETIAAIHAQGGLAIAPHPFDRGVPSLGCTGLQDRCTGPRRGAWPLDALEGLNASVLWPRRSSNTVAQHVALTLGLPAVGGSDAHSLATIGQGYTRFLGTTADDLYRAIQGGQVAWGGCCWSVAQYLDVIERYVCQRGLHGALKLAVSDGAIPLKQ